jgi:alginate O-acetyltransferase complex protein AlgI
MAYLLDINKGKIQPATDWLAFFNFVAFFPSLIAGPIDKAGLAAAATAKKTGVSQNEAARWLKANTMGHI